MDFFFFLDVFRFCMDKLLTNNHTIVNMSPLPTEILREREKKVTWSHTSKSQVVIQKALQIKREKESKIKYNGPNPPLLIFCTITKRHAMIWKEKNLPSGLWSHPSSSLKMVSGNLIFVASKHIHFNAGKDHYPQVIAVSTTASLCLTNCSQFSSVINAVVPLCVQ